MAAASSKAKTGRLQRKRREDTAKSTKSKNGMELMASHEEVVEITTTQTVVIRSASGIKMKSTGMPKVVRHAERAKYGPSAAPAPNVKDSKRTKGEAAKRNEKQPRNASTKKGPGRQKPEGHVEGDGSVRGRQKHTPAPGLKSSKCTRGEKATKRIVKMQPHDASIKMKSHRELAEKESTKGAKNHQGGQSLTPAPAKRKKGMDKKDFHNAPTRSPGQLKADRRAKGAEGSECKKGEKVTKRPSKNRKGPPNISATTSSAMRLHAKRNESRQQRQSLTLVPGVHYWTPATKSTGPEEKTTTEKVLCNAPMKTKGPKREDRVKGARGGRGRQRLPSVDIRPLTDCAYFMLGSDHDCKKGEKVRGVYVVMCGA